MPRAGELLALPIGISSILGGAAPSPEQYPVGEVKAVVSELTSGQIAFYGLLEQVTIAADNQLELSSNPIPPQTPSTTTEVAHGEGVTESMAFQVVAGGAVVLWAGFIMVGLPLYSSKRWPDARIPKDLFRLKKHY